MPGLRGLGLKNEPAVSRATMAAEQRVNFVAPSMASDGIMTHVEDPDVPEYYPGYYRTRDPLAVTFDASDGVGDGAEDGMGDYVNLEGEQRTSRFRHIAIVPMQLGALDKIHGWRQDTDLIDTPWPYRLIGGNDYSGPAHPQHANIWPLPADFGMPQGDFDQFNTQTSLYPVDVATAFPLDHAIAGDMWGIIGPNEHA